MGSFATFVIGAHIKEGTCRCGQSTEPGTGGEREAGGMVLIPGWETTRQTTVYPVPRWERKVR